MLQRGDEWTNFQLNWKCNSPYTNNRNISGEAAYVQQQRKALVNRISEACDFLKENAKRAHPKRD